MLNRRHRQYDVPVLFGLCALAFTQPLLSLLSQYPAFFTSHKVSADQLWIFTILITFFFPVILSLMILLTGLLSQKLRTGLMMMFLVFLSAVIVIPFLNQITAFSGYFALFLSVLVGMVSAWVYDRKVQFQSSLAYLSVFSFLIPLVFIFSSGIKDIAIPEVVVLTEKDGEKVKEIRPIPVVLVIFDEFTVNSIVNIDDGIDQVLYPNIAWFANRAHWFANATTVADGTAYALPAILSGQYAKRAQPTYQAYPTNIFTLLHSTHTFNAHESASKLCPPDYCPPIEKKRSRQQQIALLLIDSLVLYAHIISPIDFRRQLPDISQGWVNYLAPVDVSKVDVSKKAATQEEVQPSTQGWLLGLILSYLEDDRAALWHRFLESIPNTPQPSLNLIHILLPHLALEYLPSGKNYGRQVVRDLYNEKWGDDEWAVKQAWQRHLLQLSYTDKLLGELFQTLQNEGIFDSALIIITADHGLSFKTGEMRRPISDQNYMDILPVPLFVKLPGQEKGSVSHLNVETVDILPTIVDVLNISSPPSLEGTSVFDQEALRNRKGKTLFTFHNGERTIRFPSHLKGKQQVINERIQLFGEANDPDKLYAIGTDKRWVGKLTRELNIKDDEDYKVEVQGQVTARLYEVDSGPNFVSGTLFHKAPAIVTESENKSETRREIVRLALVVNGKVRAVTKTYQSEGDHEFAFMVPESAYQDNQNRVEIFRIVGSDYEGLRRFVVENPTIYSMNYDEGILRSLVDEKGNEFLIEPTKMMGFLDTIHESDDLYQFQGWAIDKAKGRGANQVVLFVGGRFVTSTIPQYSRPDVAVAYQQKNYESSGYRFYTEIEDSQSLCDGLIQVFAVSEPRDSGIASHLNLPSDFREILTCD